MIFYKFSGWLSLSNLSVVWFCSLKLDRNCYSVNVENMYCFASGCHREKSAYMGDCTNFKILCFFCSNLFTVEYYR